MSYKLKLENMVENEYPRKEFIWIGEQADKELEAKDKLIGELREFDLNSLLGEAVLETMLVNSELSVRLDRVRGEVKRLLNKGESNE